MVSRFANLRFRKLSDNSAALGILEPPHSGSVGGETTRHMSSSEEMEP